MHDITTSRSIPPGASTSRSKQADVRAVQNVRRYREPNPVHAFRCRASHSRNVVECVEVMKALEKGYRILQMHEVWHFPQKSDTLFKEYIDTFAKIKLEASGYPKNCVTDEQKQAYVDDIFENQGIQLDPAKISYNPGLRILAKLMLNSFWDSLHNDAI